MQRSSAGPLTPSRRRGLVLSALGVLSYRVPASAVAAFAAALPPDLDAGGVYDAGRAWAGSCRAALDAGRPLPTAADLDADRARADAARDAARDADAADLDAAGVA